MDWNTEPPGILNAPQVQHLAPGGRELKHDFAGEDIYLARPRDNPGICRIDTVHVRIDLADAGAQCRGERNRGEVRAAPAERSHPLPFLRPALEPRDDGDFSPGQAGADAVGPDVGNLCFAVHVIGDEARHASGGSHRRLAAVRPVRWPAGPTTRVLPCSGVRQGRGDADGRKPRRPDRTDSRRWCHPWRTPPPLPGTRSPASWRSGRRHGGYPRGQPRRNPPNFCTMTLPWAIALPRSSSTAGGLTVQPEMPGVSLHPPILSPGRQRMAATLRPLLRSTHSD